MAIELNNNARSGLPRRLCLLTTTKWHPLLTAFIAGALMALAFAPFQFWPVIFISLPVLYCLLDRATTAAHAAWRGFFFGYGYFMAGTWWIANALLVDIAKFGWMIPLSVLGLSGVLGIYFALLGALFRRVRTASPAANLLRFVTLWVAMEYLRSIGPFGFPWNLAGTIALASLPVAQTAAWVGSFGLSALVVLAGVAPALLRDGTSKRARCQGIAIPLLLIVGTYSYGTLRLGQPVAMTATAIRIVQPDIAQTLKGTQAGQLESVRILSALSAGAPVDVTLWPETAYPYPMRGGRADLLRPPSGLLITGALRVEGGRSDLRIFNSLVAIDAAGLVQAQYDKHQLVPFGEFVPLRSVLPLDKITPGDLDFTRGSGARTLSLPGVPSFSPLICYEVIFPWMAVDAARRPAWLLNVTNDGWYGDSPGPYQHFAMARMRAIEQGLPLVRAANSGISALIDPYGRVIARLPLDVRGALEVHLPLALEPTLYARTGEGEALLLMALLWLASGAMTRKHKPSINH